MIGSDGGGWEGGRGKGVGGRGEYKTTSCPSASCTSAHSAARFPLSLVTANFRLLRLHPSLHPPHQLPIRKSFCLSSFESVSLPNYHSIQHTHSRQLRCCWLYRQQRNILYEPWKLHVTDVSFRGQRWNSAGSVHFFSVLLPLHVFLEDTFTRLFCRCSIHLLSL